ncbi:AMP-dependent synthetase/ligase [Dactylosporangium sp. CA-092794]|uniref:AMP-dependent synthetase/ligase n=1 Tax=Dactylosporangium sp. CA-092794 TaxID=3239929 RepID=UPI003D924408
MDTVDRLAAARSLCELFQGTAAAQADRVALRDAEGTVELTWRGYADRVRSVAAGLARAGVRRGDTVALMLTNRPEFHLVDLAVLHLGATPFSVYNTSAPEQVAYLFANAGNRVVVTEGQFLPAIRAAGGAIERIVCVDDTAGDGVERLADLEAAPGPVPDLDAAWRAVGPDDVATVIYTSGTTGRPKGVELTHGAVLASLRAGQELPFLAAGSDRGRLVSYLPDAHVANRHLGHYLALAAGASITTVADGRQVAAALTGIRPTVFLGVPALWNRLKAAIEQSLDALPPRRRRLARWALATGRAAAERETSGRRLPGPLRARRFAADRLVLRRMRRRLGLDESLATITGAAPISPDVVMFFLSLGIELCEGWAMSETSAAGAINEPGTIRPGSVGRPMAGLEVRVAEDGELLLRGPSLMRGYRGEPALTAEAIDAEGWLHTGDVGTVDAGGYVTILDRKKELIINTSGKNMSPSAIENAVLAACPLAGAVMAVGDRRKYVVALITLDPDAARRLAGPGVDGAALAADPRVLAAVRDGVAKANAKLSRVEQIKTFTVLPGPWAPGGDELTPTMKLRRQAILAKYAAEIDALYDPPTREGTTAMTTTVRPDRAEPRGRAA